MAKKLILLALLAVITAGCESDVKYTKNQTTTQSVGVFEYDSCEYITIYHGVSHKGNCKYCAQRDSIKWEKRKQEIINELKSKI